MSVMAMLRQQPHISGLPTGNYRTSDFSVSMPIFQPHLATKHAIHKNEEAEGGENPKPPQKGAQANRYLPWGGIIDGKAGGAMAFGGQRAGIQPPSHTRQHGCDICARAQKRSLLLRSPFEDPHG